MPSVAVSNDETDVGIPSGLVRDTVRDLSAFPSAQIADRHDEVRESSFQFSTGVSQDINQALRTPMQTPSTGKSMKQSAIMWAD